MKNKKLLKSLAALICVGSLGVSVLAGCADKGCEHAYIYTVHEGDESTCTKAGIQTGVCQLCGNIIELELPLDSSAHDYSGDWVITLPTEENEGKAVKTCANNPEHVYEVTLPKVTLAGHGYDVAEFVTVPTTATGGEMHFEIDDANGAISFNVTVGKRELETLEDAVILASALGDNVRSSEGYFLESLDSIHNNFSVYYGDDYTYVNDDGNKRESWYSYDDDGNIFGMEKLAGASASVMSNPSEDGMLGFYYQSGSSVSSFYGAERGLRQLYDTAQKGKENGTCVGFDGDINKLNQFEDAVEGYFNYSMSDGSFFCRYNVKFTTYNDGSLKTLEIYTEIIRAFLIATDLDGNQLFYHEGDGYTDKYGNFHKQEAGDVVFAPIYPDENGVPLYATDADGNYLYEQVDENGDHIWVTEDESGNTKYVKVTVDDEGKIMETTLDYVPVLHDAYLTDMYGMVVKDANGEPIKKILSAGEDKAHYGYPVLEYYSDDNEEVSYRYVVFNQTRKVEGETVEPNPYDSNSLYVQSFDIESATLSNGTTVQFTDGKISLPTNSVVNLNISNIQPATAGLAYDPIESIYVVDPTGNRIKLGMSFNNGSAYNIFGVYSSGSGQITLNSRYAGEVQLLFVTKAGKCEKLVDVEFVKSAPTSLTARAALYTVLDGEATYIEQAVSVQSPATAVVGQQISVWAVASGEESGYVSTDVYPLIVIGEENVTFTAVEVGGYERWYIVADKPGDYVVRLRYYNGTSAQSSPYVQFSFKVTEKPDLSEMLAGNTFTTTVKVSAGQNRNPVSRTLTAQFSEDGILTVSVDGNVVTYSYEIVKDENGDAELMTEYKEGMTSEDNVSYDFSFSINEAGDLAVTHSTGMGNDRETMVLTAPSS